LGNPGKTFPVPFVYDDGEEHRHDRPGNDKEEVEKAGELQEELENWLTDVRIRKKETGALDRFSVATGVSGFRSA
jgi:hypothetical protein